mgnify:CR=1 FL=1
MIQSPIRLMVPWSSFEHLRQALLAAGESGCVLAEDGQAVLDMQGIVLVSESPGETFETRAQQLADDLVAMREGVENFYKGLLVVGDTLHRSMGQRRKTKHSLERTVGETMAMVDEMLEVFAAAKLWGRDELPRLVQESAG